MYGNKSRVLSFKPAPSSPWLTGVTALFPRPRIWSVNSSTTCKRDTQTLTVNPSTNWTGDKGESIPFWLFHIYVILIDAGYLGRWGCFSCSVTVQFWIILYIVLYIQMFVAFSSCKRVAKEMLQLQRNYRPWLNKTAFSTDVSFKQHQSVVIHNKGNRY